MNGDPATAPGKTIPWTDRMPLPLLGAAALIGSLGFATCLWMIFGSMTDVIRNNAGMCASGGPYQISPDRQCSSGSMLLIAIGGPGLFVLGALAVVAVIALLGPRGAGHLPLMGTLVFGLLGWNFLRFAVDGVGSQGSNYLCGVMFVLMAIGGLIGLVPILGLRRPGQPQENGTHDAAPAFTRARHQIYWVTFVAGTVAGAVLGELIVGAAL